VEETGEEFEHGAQRAQPPIRLSRRGGTGLVGASGP
jgi:hypothetical protein